MFDPSVCVFFFFNIYIYKTTDLISLDREYPTNLYINIKVSLYTSRCVNDPIKEYVLYKKSIL